MKAHIRIRRFGQEWLGWGKLFQGDEPPLCAMTPDEEPKVPESGDKYCAIFEHKEPCVRMNLIQFGKKFIRFMSERGNIVIPEKTIVAGPLLHFHQAHQEVEVTDMVVDIYNESRAAWGRSFYGSHGGNMLIDMSVVNGGLSHET